MIGVCGFLVVFGSEVAKDGGENWGFEERAWVFCGDGE